MTRDEAKRIFAWSYFVCSIAINVVLFALGIYLIGTATNYYLAFGFAAFMLFLKGGK
jgi:uncharacterized membrane-anchored protein YitT (DUF2179 family)